MSAGAVVMPRDVLLVPKWIRVAPASEILLPDLEPAYRRLVEDLLLRPRALFMAGSKSNDLSKKILDLYLGATAYTAATNTYGALWTTTIDDTYTAASGTEASYGTYARVLKTNNTTTWPASTGTTTASKSNGVAFAWSTSTSGTNTITYGAFVDSSSGAGNMLVYYSLTTTITVNAGDTPNLASSAFTITED